MPEVEDTAFIYEAFPWDFRDSLESYTSRGYQPHGQMVVNENACDNCSDKYKFFQVMVKYKR